jgi:hypothetical protein
VTIELRDRRGIETGVRIELEFDAARALLRWPVAALIGAVPESSAAMILSVSS